MYVLTKSCVYKNHSKLIGNWSAKKPYYLNIYVKHILIYHISEYESIVNLYTQCVVYYYWYGSESLLCC